MGERTLNMGACALGALLLLASVPASAEIYKCTDADGRDAEMDEQRQQMREIVVDQCG